MGAVWLSLIQHARLALTRTPGALPVSGGIASSSSSSSSMAWLAGRPLMQGHQLRHAVIPQRQQQLNAWQSVRAFSAQQEVKAAAGWGQKPPVSMQGLIIMLMAGAAGIAAVKSYRDEKLQKVMSQSQEVVGKASVGGPFDLIDYNGKRFTDKNLRGEFALLYFGFTHCPDICPEELEKIASAIDQVKQTTGVFVVPVFISVDPERDTPARVKAYVTEFHKGMLGLTGDLEAVKRASKAYRVYYNKTGDANSTDYLVDHSIIHYLIDPDGEFVTFYAKNYTAEQISASVAEHVGSWKSAHHDYHPDLAPIVLPPKAAVPK